VFIVWTAIIISALLSMIISFQIDEIGASDIFYLVWFFILSIFVIVEMLKWPLGKRKIDNSRGLASYIFGDADGYSDWGFRIFPRESIFSIKGKGTYWVWWEFLFSLFWAGLCLYQLFGD